MKMEIEHRTGIVALVILVVILVTSGCQYQGTTQSGSYKMLYDFQSASLHPQYVLYHFSNDSSRIYFRVKSDELLYTRTTSESPFLANFKIECRSYKPDGILEDSTSVVITDQSRSSGGWLIGHMNVLMPQGMHNVVLDCSDLKKNTSQTNYITADKLSHYSDQNFLVCDAHNDEPLFSRFFQSDRVIKILSDRNKSNTLKMNHYTDSIYPPPPPFSSSDPEMPDYSKSAEETLEQDSTAWYLLIEKGMYFISADPEKKAGLLLSTSSVYYPEIKGLSQLTSPLRYITTKSEFEEIKSHYFPKKKIDEFWIECGGNKDRARDLIRIYYNRVEEANYYFSNYTEGWRSDRGMIHIVFGNPTRIVKQQTYETWIYGEEGQAGTLTFVFKKSENPNFPNVFVLNRDPGFKQFWEKQVTSWRSGRIYNE
ncbi:MAG: GWxTD domain-containing protein [Flavobacteriales bacterium]